MLNETALQLLTVWKVQQIISVSRSRESVGLKHHQVGNLFPLTLSILADPTELETHAPYLTPLQAELLLASWCVSCVRCDEKVLCLMELKVHHLLDSVFSLFINNTGIKGHQYQKKYSKKLLSLCPSEWEHSSGLCSIFTGHYGHLHFYVKKKQLFSGNSQLSCLYL